MEVLIALLSLTVFVVGVLLMMIAWKGFLIYRDSDLEFYGRPPRIYECSKKTRVNNDDE
jgi:hypothetical protein